MRPLDRFPPCLDGHHSSISRISQGFTALFTLCISLYGFISVIFSWYIFTWVEEHPSMSRTGPIYINCSQLNDEQHITLTPRKCPSVYDTLYGHPTHIPCTHQKLRWSKTEPLIFCSKSTHSSCISYLDKWHSPPPVYKANPEISVGDREKARSLPNYSSAGGSIFE